MRHSMYTCLSFQYLLSYPLRIADLAARVLFVRVNAVSVHLIYCTSTFCATSEWAPNVLGLRAFLAIEVDMLHQ